MVWSIYSWRIKCFGGRSVFKQLSTSGLGLKSNVDSAYVNSEVGGLPRSLDETKFYDAEAAVDSNAWGDDSLTFDRSHNMADADTPPSTPRSSIGYGANAAEKLHDCGGSGSGDCPCIRALVALNNSDDGMLGIWKTPDRHKIKKTAR